MVEQTTGETVLDSQAADLLRHAIQQTLNTSATGRSIDIPLDSGVYLGFTPATGETPPDVVGQISIYVPDLTHHQRVDELGYPYAKGTDIYDQSKTLNVLANELRQLLYEELDCDHSFTRTTTKRGGSACYAATVTAAASHRDSPRLPDDEQ